MNRRVLTSAGLAAALVLPLSGATAATPTARTATVFTASPSVAGLVEVTGDWRDPRVLASRGDRIWFSGRDGQGRSGIWLASATGRPTRIWTAQDQATAPTRAVALGQRLLAVVDGKGESGSSILALSADAKQQSLRVGKGEVDEIVVVGNRAYFGQFDGRAMDALFVTDGTSEGTHWLATFGWSPTRGGDALGQLTAVGDRLWFSGRDPVHGTEPWTSDGTPAGTKLVKDVAPGPTDSAPADFIGARKTWFSTWRNGLQRSDGTAGGTTRVKAGRLPWGQTVKAGQAVYVVSDKVGTGLRDRWRLWRTDGTPAGSGPVGRLGRLMTEDREVGLWSDGRELTVLTGNPKSWALWSSNGRRVTKLREIEGPMPGRDFADHAFVAGRTFFAGTDAEAGPELWVTDQTEVGTVRVADLVPGAVGSQPHGFTAAGSSLWFVATGTGGPALYRYTPTSVLPEAPSVQVAGVRAPVNLTRPTLDLMLGTDQNATATVTGTVALPGGRRVAMRPVSTALFADGLSKVSVVPVRPGLVARAVRAHRKAQGATKAGLAVTATVTVVLTDRFGQSTRSTVTEPLV